MKKLILFMTMMLALFGCSAGQLTDDDRKLMAEEGVDSVSEPLCYGKPVATDWGGCKPGVTCPSPPSIFSIESGHNVDTYSGVNRDLWIYYDGTWQKALSFGSATIDAYFSGSIGKAGGPPLRKIMLTNQTYYDGPGALIKAECMNPTTGHDECFYDEIAVHRMWFATPTTCYFGLWTSGLTRLVGLGDTTGEGDFSFRGWNTAGGVTSYVSCDVRLKNSCSGP